MPPKRKKQSMSKRAEKDASANPTWFPTTIAKAPEGIYYNPAVLSQPIVHPPPPYAQSHEILGGIILGSGHHNLAQNLNLKPNPLGPGPGPIPEVQTHPVSKLGSFKPPKYVGVTYRSNRVKFQSRIYKDNCEYNLGLFNLSTDAALAYDITHRLIAEIHDIVDNELNDNASKKDCDANLSSPCPTEAGADSTNAVRVEIGLKKLDELESVSNSPSEALTWLDHDPKDVIVSSSDKETERLNFYKPQDFYKARKKEIAKRKLKPSNKQLEESKKLTGQVITYPDIDTLKMLIRRVVIRMAKVIIAATSDISGNNDAKKKKTKESDVSSSDGKKSENISNDDLDIPLIPKIPDTDEFTTWDAEQAGSAKAEQVQNANTTNPSGAGMNAAVMPAMYGMGMNVIDPRIHYAPYPAMGPAHHVMPGVTAAAPNYYNPAMQYHHAVGGVLPAPGYTIMPNAYGHVAGHAMMVPPPSNVMMGATNAAKSTEAIDQQKHQLQMQVAAHGSNGYPGIIGLNTYQNHQVSSNLNVANKRP